MLSRLTRAVAGLVTTLVVIVPVPTRAEQRAVPPALDEATFIRRVHVAAPKRAALDARVHAAGAAVAAAGVQPNPIISYEREAAPGARIDFYRLGWTVDLANRAGLATSIARAEADAERATVTWETFVVEIEAREAYLTASHARERVARIEQARTALAAIVDTLRARASQGDASDYDAERATLELDTIDDELADARRELGVARLRVGAWLGEPDVAYEASDPLVMPRVLAGRVKPERADVDAVRAKARHAERELELARRTWIPRLQLVGGLIHADTTGSDGFGYVFSIAGELPLLERGRAAAAHSRAERARWEREADALVNDANAEVAQARQALAARIAQADAYGAGAAKRALDLERRVLVAYREGDRPITELLDMQRTARQTAVRALELVFEARRAELALHRALGRQP